MNEIDFNYCPRCGSLLKLHLPNLTVCKSCGLEWYINPRPCNAIIIMNEKNAVLLTKRAFEPAQGKWDLPGGFVNLGETLEESVMREAKEELGIELSNITYFCSGPDRYLFSGVNYHTIGAVFTARIAKGEVKVNDDVSEAKFVKYVDINFEEMAFPILRETLRLFFEKTS